MTRFLLFTVCFIGLAFMAQAQSYTPMPPTEKQAKPNTPVVPWSKFCRQLVSHHPVSNVDYKPGPEQCDVHGNPVLPADVTVNDGFVMPKEYRMFITASQAKALNVKIPDNAMASNMLIGEVVVDDKGNVTFEGQKIQTETLYKVCQDLEN